MKGNHKLYHDGTNALMAEHNIPFQGANDVMYMRKQGVPENSELEQKLIEEYKQGNRPNVLDYVK